MFSKMQEEYLKMANHRWNFKTGATRAGKTYLDYFLIPRRIRSLKDKEGAVMILGVSKATLQRNLLEPMQKIWGRALVGNINSMNKCFMFGEWVYCLGAEKASQVAKIQGMGVKYCYGDEVAKWSPEVFNFLKTRLDKPHSIFDGTCNPEQPTHWLKQFFDSDADVYCQKYTLFDNPFLDDKFVKNLCKEYLGTVYYDRYVLGEWRRAEGVCYPKFADNSSAFIVDKVPDNIIFGQIGIDFGGYGSAHSFQLTGVTKKFEKIVTLEEFYHSNKEGGVLSPKELEDCFVDFVEMCKSKYKFPIIDVFADSAEQTLIAGLKVCALKNSVAVDIHNAKKGEIRDRIRLYNRLFSQGRFFIMEHCKKTISAFMEAVFDEKSATDKRVDDGSCNIDTLDAQEYSTENITKQLNEYIV